MNDLTEEKRAFARRWHDELRGSIRADQERRETVLRSSLPLVFAVLASSAAVDPLTADDALWRWLAAGVILLVAIETTHRASMGIIHAGARTERLEQLDPGLPPHELSVHEPASERLERLPLPPRFRPLWPRPGRSRLLSFWYVVAAAGAIAYWFSAVSDASIGQTIAALALPIVAILAAGRLFFSGRLHWQRDRLVARDRLLKWVEEGFSTDSHGAQARTAPQQAQRRSDVP